MVSRFHQHPEVLPQARLQSKEFLSLTASARSHWSAGVSSLQTLMSSRTSSTSTSNLNVVAGQVIPNMVLARVGTNGSVVLSNNAGTVDLVADVMGYFTG